jgi:hypothetical protein
MARMILTLSAVFFFTGLFCGNVSLLANSSCSETHFKEYLASKYLSAQSSQTCSDDMTLEALARGVSMSSVYASTDLVVSILNGVLDRYPHLKFAFCVTLQGDLVVINESLISPFVRAPYSDRTVQPPSQGAPPITAFHIASMTSGVGYHELPRPVPVQAPAVVYTGVAPVRPTPEVNTTAIVVSIPAANNTTVVVSNPQGQAQLSRPSSPWRSIFPNNDASYLLVIGLPDTAF